MDYLLDIVDSDVEAYRTAFLVRMSTNFGTAILYLMFSSHTQLFHSSAKHVTTLMLSVQGAALLVAALFVYNNELIVFVIFGIYVSSYSVCDIAIRLCICMGIVVSYFLTELFRCETRRMQDVWGNLLFLISFLCFSMSGVRMEEFMDRVTHYENKCLAAQSDSIKLMKVSCNELLTNLLPPHVVALVHDGVSPIAEFHEDISVIFTDIKGFTAFSSGLSAAELMSFLNSMYSAFDEVILNWGLFKVEVIGDAYCIASGCPAETPAWPPADAAMRAVEVALAMLRTMSQVCNDSRVQMRVGVHSGPVVAGVVGRKGPRFHLFGPTVVYTEKMESHGEPGRVHISDAAHEILQQGGHEYDFEERNIRVEGIDGLQRT
jgi:class 3 adenylate cyclase